jgi:hypothetical protein
VSNLPLIKLARRASSIKPARPFDQARAPAAWSSSLVVIMKPAWANAAARIDGGAGGGRHKRWPVRCRILWRQRFRWCRWAWRSVNLALLVSLD